MKLQHEKNRTLWGIATRSIAVVEVVVSGNNNKRQQPITNKTQNAIHITHSYCSILTIYSQHINTLCTAIVVAGTFIIRVLFSLLVALIHTVSNLLASANLPALLLPIWCASCVAPLFTNPLKIPKRRKNNTHSTHTSTQQYFHGSNL